MPTLTTYKPLAHDERYLKGIGAAATSQEAGITVNDLREAERIAKNTIDSWIIKLAGDSRGTVILAELEGGVVAVPQDIGDLADLHASSIVWGWYQTRNFANLQRSDAPEGMAAKITEQAVALANRIQTSGKIRKADGSILRLRMGPPGPAVGGPMESGSMFDDKGYMKDYAGRTRFIPHRHPLDDQGMGRGWAG